MASLPEQNAVENRPSPLGPAHRAELLAFGCVEPGTEEPILDDLFVGESSARVKPAVARGPVLDRPVMLSEFRDELGAIAIAVARLEARA